MCKSKHDEANGDIPLFLCRDCNPGAFKPSAPIVEAPVTPAGMNPLYKKHKLRKLRSEERRLGKIADDLGQRDRVALNRVYEALKVVEKEIDKVSAS